MKKNNFVLLPLAALVAASVQANQTEKLDIINVVTENTGAKSKTNVVTTEVIDKRTETDLRGLLNEEPSINFGGGTGTSQWFTIRGMGQDQVDVKVDNAYSDTQIFHHQGRFMLDPSLVKIVSVQKGTGSASAGIGATSGAIVAKTLDAKDLLKDGQRIGFKVNGGYSSNEGHSKGATVFAKAQNLDVLFSGNFVTEKNFKPGKGYENTEGGNKVLNSGLNQRGLLAKFGLDLNDDHRVVVGHRQEKHYGMRALREEFDFAQSWTPVTSKDGNFNLSDKQQKRWSEQGYSLRKEAGSNNSYYLVDRKGDLVPYTSNNSPSYRITTTDTSTIEWSGQNMGFISRSDVNAYRMIASRTAFDSKGKSRTKVITNGANINLDSDIGSSHVIKYGVNWRDQASVPASLNNGLVTEKKKEVGAYVEGIWGVGPVTLTTGLRYDYFDLKTNSGKKTSDGDINPSLGVIWEVTKDLSLNSSLNYATRSPRMYEAMLSGFRAISVADDIKAEKSRNIETGFNYNLTDMLSLNGSYFWQNIKHIQAITNADQNGIRSIYNGGTLKNNGYEVGAAFKYSGLTVRAGVAYSKPELDGTTLDSVVTAVPIGRTWTTGVSYKFEKPSLELGWRGRFAQNANYDTETNNRGGGTTTTKRPGYGVNDFYVTWEALDNLNVNFAVNNAFNKLYKSHSQRAGTSALPAVGRDFRVNINYTF